MAGERVVGYDNFAGAASADAIGRATDSGHLWGYKSSGPVRVNGSGLAYDAFFNGPRIVFNARVPNNYRVSIISKVSVSTNRVGGPAVCVYQSGDTGIFMDFNNGNWMLRRYVAGTATTLQTIGGNSPTSEMLVELDKQGNIITPYFNGVATAPWEETVLQDPGQPGAVIISADGVSSYSRAYSVSAEIISFPALARQRIFVPTSAAANVFNPLSGRGGAAAQPLAA